MTTPRRVPYGPRLMIIAAVTLFLACMLLHGVAASTGKTPEPPSHIVEGIQPHSHGASGICFLIVVGLLGLQSGTRRHPGTSQTRSTRSTSSFFRSATSRAVTRRILFELCVMRA